MHGVFEEALAGLRAGATRVELDVDRDYSQAGRQAQLRTAAYRATLYGHASTAPQMSVKVDGSQARELLGAGAKWVGVPHLKPS